MSSSNVYLLAEQMIERNIMMLVVTCDWILAVSMVTSALNCKGQITSSGPD